MRALKILSLAVLFTVIGYIAWTAHTNLSSRLNAGIFSKKNSPEAEELLQRMASIPQNGPSRNFLNWLHESARTYVPGKVVNIEFGIPVPPSTLSLINEVFSILHQKTPKLAQGLIRANQYVEARKLLINTMKIARTLERTYEITHVQRRLKLEKELIPLLYELFATTTSPAFLKEFIASLQEVERLALPFDEFIIAERAKIAIFLEQPSRLSELYPIEDTTQTKAPEPSMFYWWFHKREVVEDAEIIYKELELRSQLPPRQAEKVILHKPTTDVGNALQSYGKRWDQVHHEYAFHSTLLRLLLLECASKSHKLGSALFDPDNPKGAHPIYSDLKADPLSGNLFLKREDGKWYSPGKDGKDEKGGGDDLWLPHALQLPQH